jgi:hypothetical protein
MSHTPAQTKGDIVRRSRERLRMEQLRQHSQRGTTLQDAADAIGMRVSGVRNLLYRATSSTAWPIEGFVPAAIRNLTTNTDEGTQG